MLEIAERNELLDYRRKISLPDKIGHVHQRELSSQIHHLSTAITDLMRMTALGRGENVIIDGSLAWQPLAQQYVGELLEAGYQSATVISIDIPEAEAVERTRNRWWQDRNKGEPGGRFVPEEVVRTPYERGHSSCIRNAEELAEQAKDEIGAGELIQYKFDRPSGRTVRVTP